MFFVDFFHHSKKIWIGATDLLDEGNFHWVGSKHGPVQADASYWNGGKPSSADNDDEDCVQYKKVTNEYLWNDDDCDERHYFICEGKNRLVQDSYTSLHLIMFQLGFRPLHIIV